jgi:hypothetical protein
MCKLSDHIHNSIGSNIEMAIRLANTVLDKKYNIIKAPEQPVIYKVEKNEEEFSLFCKNAVGVLKCIGTDETQYLPIKISDDDGDVEIKEYILKDNMIKIIVKRPIIGKSYISSYYGRNPRCIIIDSETQLPLMCFENVEVS